MPTNVLTHSHDSAAATVNLMPYINAVINAGWWILAAALLTGTLAGIWTHSKPYMFQAGAKISVVDIEDPGGVSPDDRRASEVLTLVEHGFVMGTTRDNYNAVMRARLVSRDFTVRFLDKFNIYQYFYPEHWDQEGQRWIGGFSPDRGESFTRFRDEVRTVAHDDLTDIITISMKWPDAALARDWANLYVKAFNEFIREKTMLEVERKQIFLHAELRRSDVVEIQQSIYRLIEAQTAIAMLANAREEYAMEIIDPAAMPYKSFNMSRKRKIVLAAIAGSLLAIFVVLASVLVRGMFRTLITYRELERQARTTHHLFTPLESGDL